MRQRVLKLVKPSESEPPSTPSEFSSESGGAMRNVPFPEEAVIIGEHKCQICDQVFKSEGDLNAHVKSHLIIERGVEDEEPRARNKLFLMIL